MCAKHRLPWRDVVGRSRSRNIVRARQECCYRLRAELRMSAPRIGRCLGGIDHTTVLHACTMHAARNGLPLLTGSFYQRKRAPKRTGKVVRLKAGHSTRRDRQARIKAHIAAMPSVPLCFQRDGE